MSTTILYNSCNKQLLNLKKQLLTATGSNREEFKAKLLNLKNNVQELKTLGKREVSLDKRLALKDKVELLEKEISELSICFDKSVETFKKENSTDFKDLQNFQEEKGFRTNEIILDFHNTQGASLLNSENRVEEFISLSSNALKSLREERDILKSSKRRLLDSLHFLGLSNSVIRRVEARFRQDYYILYFGIFFCLVLFYLMVRYLK
jgi:hypothetical protein